MRILAAVRRSPDSASIAIAMLIALPAVLGLILIAILIALPAVGALILFATRISLPTVVALMLIATRIAWIVVRVLLNAIAYLTLARRRKHSSRI